MDECHRTDTTNLYKKDETEQGDTKAEAMDIEYWQVVGRNENLGTNTGVNSD